MKCAVILSLDLIVRQWYLVCLTPTHELILVIVIREVHFDILKCGKHKRLGVNHPEVQVNCTDERLKNILKDILIGVPPIAHTLVIHENPVVQPELFRNST